MGTNYQFETKAIHAGAAPDPITGSRQTPIHLTTSYQFKSSEHAANLFALKEFGYIYSRLHNPTVAVLEQRLASLEGGVFAVATNSGHAAQLIALFNLLESGDEFVAAKKLYGGSINQFSKSFKQFGWNVKFFDESNPESLNSLITDKTKAVFIESVTNPEGNLVDIEAIANIAHKHNIPLLVDNTVATPYLINPIQFGADIVIHSTTKFLSGQGTVLGGIIIDSGKFPFEKFGNKFPLLNNPDSSYNQLVFTKAFGNLGFSVRAIAVGLRDLGCQQSAFDAFITLNGIETLSLRIQQHAKNAAFVAQWLSKHPKISWVSHPSTKPETDLHKKYGQKGFSSVFTFKLKNGTLEQGVKFVESLKLFSHLANIGDTRSLVIHPASTTHSQLSEENKILAGAGPELIRLSIGIENQIDLIQDLEQALEKV
ncbi:MAG: O-acetylhomoserine aminocarboxypropyltransferase/cysteine synthase [Alphaproteobacteria bacterium]|nr:O-acetylhomoserine aminocarboxypropyltransferase/cysteine synthase [Alphaproteobacteria bacterium]